MTGQLLMPSSPAKSCRRCRRYRACCGLVLLLCAIACGWFAVRWQRACQQRETVAALSRIDACEVAYDGGDVFDLTDLFRQFFGDKRSCRLAPVSWAEGIFGKHFTHRCETVGVDYFHVDEVLPYLGKLPYLRQVVIQRLIGGESEADWTGASAAMAKIRACVPGIEPKFIEFDTRIGVSNEMDEAVEVVEYDEEISEEDAFAGGIRLIAEQLGNVIDAVWARLSYGVVTSWFDRDSVTRSELGAAPAEQKP